MNIFGKCAICGKGFEKGEKYLMFHEGEKERFSGKVLTQQYLIHVSEIGQIGILLVN